MQQQLQQLKEQSVQIVKGMLAYWSNTDRTQELDPDKYVGRLKDRRVFAIAGKNARRKVVCFAYKNEMYVTPYTKEAVQTLRNANYAEYAFFVPLSPEEMSLVPLDPVTVEKLEKEGKEDPAAKWQRLIAEIWHLPKQTTDDLEVRWSQSVVAPA